MDVVAIAICAVICGADSWMDVEWFGKSKEDWFSGFLEIPNGIPSHDTFGRVFSALDAEQFQNCFINWVKAVSEVTKGQIVSIDGKTLRGSGDDFIGKSAIHMVNAWASANHLVLGQTSQGVVEAQEWGDGGVSELWVRRRPCRRDTTYRVCMGRLSVCLELFEVTGGWRTLFTG